MAATSIPKSDERKKTLKSYEDPSRLSVAQQVLPRIWLGPVNEAKNLKSLQEKGIVAIINCTKPDDVPNYFSSQFQYLRVPVIDEDGDDGDISNYFTVAHEFIDRVLSDVKSEQGSQGAVLIH